MATVSRGEITITNVDDGKPSYTHTAYAWSADGTDRFTTAYPEENLQPNSTGDSVVGYNPWNSNGFELSTNGEWINVKVTNTSSPNGVQFPPITFEKGITYTISLDVKALTNFTATYCFLIGSTGNIKLANVSVSGSENGVRVTIKATPTYDANYMVMFGWNGDELSKNTDVYIKNIKVEKGDTATPYTPSPSEDFENAYPKFTGTYVDDQTTASTDPAAYTWQRILGQGGGDGKDGESAPLISLSGATQAITIDKDGKITPASSYTVIGTAVNTSISNWTYSLNGGNFGSAVPAGVTRSGNTVTINPATATFNQLTIRAADATVRDEFTISRIKDGGDGTPGADAYTVFLTNESYTFAGSTDAALTGSTTTEVVVYKGINKITPTSITVGTKPTGLTSSVSGSVVTFVAATTLVTKSGTIPLTITADGKTFTKQFAYAISFQGGKGEPGQNGVSVTGTQVQYVQSSGTTEPTTGWSNTRPTPVPGQWLWTRSRSILSDGTYGSWVTVPTLIGREAIVINATAPSNPSTGTLWQMPSDPNVKQWDGTKWVDWGISIDNIIADNLVAKDGKFEEIEGIKITGSEFQNPFTNEPINGGDGTTGSSASGLATLKGKLSFDGEIDTSHKFATEYGPVRLGGTVRLKTASATTDPALMWWLNPYGLTLMVDGVGGTLRYQDLLFYDDTLLSASSGFSQYATSGDNAPMVSRTGRNVRLSGAFKNNSELPINADMIMGVLPEWARPSRLVVQRQQASFNNGYLLTVKTDGTMSMSRHAAGASNVTVPAGSWLNIAVGYSAKDF
ncbi:hypothetical protein [Enterococcus casseliflavus]|uniref:hypothetical protein n=1 Tax=Enterococcus casseliflavus TaxID=37734 RepID=UPI0039A58370